MPARRGTKATGVLACHGKEKERAMGEQGVVDVEVDGFPAEERGSERTPRAGRMADGWRCEELVRGEATIATHDGEEGEVSTGSTPAV